MNQGKLICSNWKGSSFLMILTILMLIVSLISCKKYLDEKPDKKLIVPRNLNDLQLLLDNYSFLNSSYNSAVEALTDNYYISFSMWGALDPRSRSYYTWQKNDNNNGDWVNGYNKIYIANVVLDNLSTIKYNDTETNKYDEVKGSALFYRAFLSLYLAQLFAQPYDKISASKDLGIPLRLNSDFNETSVRSSVGETYNQILADLKNASKILPLSPTSNTRPSKCAALAAIARTYLLMQDYKNAGLYADSALQIKDDLIDFNGLAVNTSDPIPQFNAETIFYARTEQELLTYPGICNIDTLLIKSYSIDDLRTNIFFQKVSGVYWPKGNHSGFGSAGMRFAGLATNEMYLTRAECNVRAGKVEEALLDLNKLLANRWTNSVIYVPVAITNADEVLEIILNERRKELVFSLLRWSDLRRLNKEERFAKTLKRVLNGVEYNLGPNTNGYTIQIPKVIIDKTGMTQNP